MAKPGPDGDQTMNDAQFIDRAYNAVLSRPPSQEETAACLQFLNDQTALLVDPSRLTPAAVGDTGGLPPAKEPSVRAKENLVLSGQRAAAVVRYLVGKGFTAKRFDSEGLGSTKPRVENDTKENRALNRRVEVHILDGLEH